MQLPPASRQPYTRLVMLGVLSLGALLLALLPTVAARADAPDAPDAPGPTAVSLTGPNINEALTVQAKDGERLFKELLSEVDWLWTRAANAPAPEAAALGPKFRLTVLIEDKPAQLYDIYPLAVGGPRVFRPADQPQGKVAEAWFYGRVSMPETLQNIGVPLVLPSGGNPGTAGGGGGTGTGVTGGGVAGPGVKQPGKADPQASGPSIGKVLSEWQRGVLLVGGGALVLLLMLGGVSLLIRRR